MDAESNIPVADWRMIDSEFLLTLGNGVPLAYGLSGVRGLPPALADEPYVIDKLILQLGGEEATIGE